ncbi:MAG TPA: DinB family protein [Chitinophagaceae bacterium]
MKNVFHASNVISLIILTAFCSFSAHPGNHKDSHGKPINDDYKKLQTSISLSAAVERQLYFIEKNIIDVAEAMPADKFDFTPESLTIPNSEFKDVRTFAGQVKHLATDNFSIWSPVTGDPLRSDITDVNGPASIKTKPDIIKYLKESFAQGHKAIATLTDQNAMEMLEFRGNKLPRLDLVFYALTHSNEHYGQMVVYLRLCGIVPPASRPVKN